MVVSNKYAQAKQKILSAFKDSEILSVMQLKDGFLFSIKPKQMNDYVLDGFFKVTNAGSIKEYSPVTDPEEFKFAMSHVIYSKKNR